MARLRVEVVYALADGVDAVVVELGRGATVADALRASGLPQRHPEIVPEKARAGVFGRERRPGEALADGDRVEVYRPLKVDPGQARRERARRLSRRTSR
jgi:putative ubiquitin-RnfH superfamily antitoxin RatB of RatAB toxin-antitoxin module